MATGVASAFLTGLPVNRAPEAIALERTVLLSRDFVSTEISDDDVVRALQAPTVALVADEVNIQSQVGQTVFVTLAQLIVALGRGRSIVGPRDRSGRGRSRRSAA